MTSVWRPVVFLEVEEGGQDLDEEAVKVNLIRFIADLPQGWYTGSGIKPAYSNLCNKSKHYSRFDKLAKIICRETPIMRFCLLFYIYQSSFGLSPMQRDSFTDHIRSPKLHSIVEVVVLR